MAAYGWALATLLATAPLRVASLSAQPVSAPAAARVTVNHAAFDSLLRAHVTDGLVDYDAFRDAAAFRRYLASLARTSLAGADDEEQLAFWINVYNAYTIQLIVAHGERESIRNVNRTLGVLRLKGPWSEPIVRAAGRLLKDSPTMQVYLNQAIERVVVDYIAPWRVQIGSYIVDVVQSWDGPQIAETIELQVGSDLQYIRINGRP